MNKKENQTFNTNEFIVGIYSLTWLFQILYHIVPEETRLAPKVASAITKYEATGCDETSSIILTFPTGAQGIATTSIRVVLTVPVAFSSANMEHRSHTLRQISKAVEYHQFIYKAHMAI